MVRAAVVSWILLAATASLWAQTAPRKASPSRKAGAPKPAATKAAPAVQAPVDRWPLARIVVEGNRQYKAEQILAAAGLSVGKLVNQAIFDAARDQLLKTGVFDVVGYKFNPTDDGRVEASLQVTEIGDFFPLKFEALDVDTKALSEFLRQRDPLYGPKIAGTKGNIDRYATLVKEFLARNGQQEEISARVTIDGAADDLVLLFHPARLPAVAEVYFRGNEVIEEPALQRAVAGGAIGAIFTEPRFRQILEIAVRPMYENLGRLRIAFPRIETKPAEKVQGLVVTVTVVEGPVYNVGEITASANVGPEIVKEAGLRPGAVGSAAELTEAANRMVAALRRSGYLKAAGKPRRVLDDKEKTVNLHVELTPGRQYQFGGLRLEGLDILTEPQVRKLWAPKPGKPFNGEYPEYFLARLREDAVLENMGKTRSELKIDEERQVVDVVLYFKGAGEAPRTIHEPPNRRRMAPY